MNTLLFISLGVFVLYNGISLGLFGIPQSLSETFYLYKNNYKCGFLFPLMMYLTVGTLMPWWITLSEGSTFQFLSFLAPAALLFVGTSPAFKSSDLENKVHTISAYIAAAFALLWIILVTPYWYTVFIGIGVTGIFSYITTTYKSSLIYWLEMVVFLSTYTTFILYIM